MALDDPEFPKNGYSLVYFEGGKPVNATALTKVKTDWSIVWQVWPFVVFGFLVGVSAAYPLGELARRKFVIDQASEDAIELSKEILLDAKEREHIAQQYVAQAQSMLADLEHERREVGGKKYTAELYMEKAEEIRQQNVSLQKELAKAKAKIRRLEGKGNTGRAKPVDFGL
jgi:F0F1-type ATP synthase membrane subunit b/b'